MTRPSPMPVVRRGDVWYASTLAKRRPVLVLTRDPLAGILNSVICAPITSRRRGLETEVVIGADAGLEHVSVANFDNVFLAERGDLIRRLGRVPDATMRDACAALARAVDCSGAP